MERNRKTKVIAILALVVAVVGMSLGFAAFSNILTISSSATVTPSETDFKMAVYGIGEDNKLTASNEIPIDFSNYSSSTESIPYSIGAIASNASINSGSMLLELNNLSVNFSEPGQKTNYWFAIRNEGNYDAFINLADYANYYINGYKKTCTAGATTTQNLVEQACQGIEATMTFYLPNGENMANKIGNNGLSVSYKISKNDYVILWFSISYEAGATRADGNFSVQFDDIIYEFTTVAKNSILNQ